MVSVVEEPINITFICSEMAGHSYFAGIRKHEPKEGTVFLNEITAS
jgi:hypothetical protein